MEVIVKKIKILICVASIMLLNFAFAQNSSKKENILTIPMQTTSGQEVGTVSVTETPYGLLFTPALHNLPAGVHGFHIHQNASCGEDGMAAGGHFDPSHSNKHLGPYNNQGHLGDLPVLIVNDKGIADMPILAPRLKKLSEIEKHTLMIHQGGDNYSDVPTPLGGGGARIACGVIP